MYLTLNAQLSVNTVLMYRPQTSVHNQSLLHYVSKYTVKSMLKYNKWNIIYNGIVIVQDM